MQILALATVGCEQHPSKEQTTEANEPSPNASITPAPLLSGTRLLPKPAKNDGLAKGGKRPRNADLPREPPEPFLTHLAPSRDHAPAKMATRVELAAELLWPSHQSTLRPVAATLDRQREFRDKTRRSLAIQLRSNGRMRVDLGGRLFPVAAGSQIRARYENYGHILVWPEADAYRVLPLGSLAALLSEGRPDVTPLVNVEAEAKPGAVPMNGRTTRVWSFETTRGTLQLSQVELPEAGLGGALLCRFLLEWLSLAPTATACDENLLPVRAEYTVEGGGLLLFFVRDLEVRTDPQLNALLVPPDAATYRNYGVPSPDPVLSDVDLSALRHSKETAQLDAYNDRSTVAYLLLDGTPVAMLPPLGSVRLSGISRGQFSAELVDHFGREVVPPSLVQLKDTVSIGTASIKHDAGADL